LQLKSSNGDLSSSTVFYTVSFGAYLMFLSMLCISMYVFVYVLSFSSVCRLETVKRVFELRCEFGSPEVFQHFLTDTPTVFVYTQWCIYRVAKKTSQNLRNYNSTYTLWCEISFGTFVDQYVWLLTYCLFQVIFYTIKVHVS